MWLRAQPQCPGIFSLDSRIVGFSATIRFGLGLQGVCRLFLGRFLARSRKFDVRFRKGCRLFAGIFSTFEPVLSKYGADSGRFLDLED